VIVQTTVRRVVNIHDLNNSDINHRLTLTESLTPTLFLTLNFNPILETPDWVYATIIHKRSHKHTGGIYTLSARELYIAQLSLADWPMTNAENIF